MFFWTKPNRESIHAFISSQQDAEFPYSGVGRTRTTPPKGYTVDRNRIRLGTGADDFERARNALRDWKMFDISRIELCWPDTPIEAGNTVAVLVSHYGFRSLNACRIVYVLEEHGELEKFGFAYGTLPSHAERGEERFTVEYHEWDQSVWYDIFAFSRPGPLARLAYPLARALQFRFARDSKAAMFKAVQQK